MDVREGGSGRPSLSCPPDAGAWVSPSGLLKYLCCEAMHASQRSWWVAPVVAPWWSANSPHPAVMGTTGK